MKIPFDIKYRPQIESGEYKVETKNGYQVEILKFGIEGPDFHIAGIIHRIYFDEVVSWTNKGMFHPEIFRKESPNDLVLITPEPELTESEDERIRKNCIHFLKLQKAHHADTSEIDDCIAYLEKQKEQKPISLNEPYNPDDYEVVMEGNATGLRQKEQKFAEWSEEDEKPFNDVLSGLKYTYEDLMNNKSFDSAKDIKEAFDWMQARVKFFRPKPKQEWSEEDERMRKRAICACNFTIAQIMDEGHYQAARDWLKSLRPTTKK